MEPKNPEEHSHFGKVVASMGSVLIIIGIAWLLAQNWHQISSALKIIILVAFTITALISGTLLRLRHYEGIGVSLISLGALLYTLSIFLIAQIFSTTTSLQGTAWLWALAWVGVLIIAYVLDTPLCLVVALAEFITWLVIQYLALTSFGYMDFGVGLLVLLFLAVGVLLYGLSLLHGASNHLFARVYQWWTAFYLLAFTYLLSFQIVLAFLGVGVSFSEFTTKAGMFFIATAIIALISFFIGWGAAKNAKQINTKEITWFIGIVFALIILTFTPHALAFTEAYAISETEEGGSCWAVSCYDSTTEAGCIKNTDALSCIWTPGRCFEGSCSDLSPDISSEESCAANKNCVWERNTCNEISCRDLGETTCDVAKGCIWEKGESDRPYCRWLSCERYTTAKECSFDTFNLECKWENNWCQDLYCRDMKSENACLSKSCLWEEQSFCEVDQEALDNKGDLANTECMGYKNKNTCEGVNHCMWSEFGSSGFGLDPGYGLFGEGEMTGRAWFVWIFSNLIFLTLILIIISYGTLHKLPRIINLGIFFFTIDIIARYIGFIMDFSGYTSLSIIFITGGILLIFGGWGIEKWRRNLIAKTK